MHGATIKKCYRLLAEQINFTKYEAEILIIISPIVAKASLDHAIIFSVSYT